MKKFSAVLMFVVMTFLCWGTYGPVLHLGQNAMEKSRWRPFICVGLAYFFIAVVVPTFMMGRQRESGRWTVSGIIWSIVAGAVGAVGSLGIIMAFNWGGKPVWVMPLVFGCAPVVNTFVTMFFNRKNKPEQWKTAALFYLSIAIVALGGAGVLRFKPKPAVAATAAETADETTPADSAEPATPAVEEAEPTEAAEEKADQPPAESDAESAADATAAVANPTTVQASVSETADDEYAPTVSRWLAALCVLMTICCWGSYGPVLHKGQAKMEGSRLRPFICVGLAYMAIAVIIPALVLMQSGEAGMWSPKGVLWSLAAGALGAIGALGIIMAFNFGGKPIFVMPLVFGGAPVINTLTSMWQSYLKNGNIGEINNTFLACVGMVIAGAVGVLLFAPKHKKKAAPIAATSATEASGPESAPSASDTSDESPTPDTTT